MAAKRLPLVAICGRPNVGKSTLFNRIGGKQRAIIHDEEGITRDRHETTATWESKRFRLVDTGGIIENPIDPVLQKMQSQIEAALAEASVVIFVADGQQPLTRVDYEVRDQLLRLNKPVVLAVNKLDNTNLEMNRHDFYELGIGEPYAISSGHNLGVGDMMDAVVGHLPEGPYEEIDDEPQRTRIAIVGKPNVGKSSFVNAILNESRTIVDDVPGTTRDAIDIEFTWQDKDYLLIDTAGLRKKAGIKHGGVEQFSVSRTLRAVRRADVCLVMVDATEGLAEQDKRVLGYVIEQGTAFVMVWTKWDLIDDKERKFKALMDELDFKAPHFKYAPSITISNVTRQRIYKSFEIVDEIAINAERRISTGEFNRFIQEIKMQHKPSSKKGKAAKILYGTQSGVKPTTFVLFVNQKRLVHFSYLRYIENRIREQWEFSGVPITIELREGKPKP